MQFSSMNRDELRQSKVKKERSELQANVWRTLCNNKTRQTTPPSVQNEI